MSVPAFAKSLSLTSGVPESKGRPHTFTDQLRIDPVFEGTPSSTRSRPCTGPGGVWADARAWHPRHSLRTPGHDTD